jgi:hypothetical protein
VSVSEVSDVEPGGDGCRWADGQAGTNPAANDICRVELYSALGSGNFASRLVAHQ